MKQYRQKFYLAIRPSKYYALNGRLFKTTPALYSSERLLQIEIAVPESLFQTPQLSAKIEVPENSVSSPVISIETVNNIRELVKQNLGVELTINIVEPKKEEEE